MAQLMPLPFTVSCFSKIQIGFTFLVLAYPDSPGQRDAKQVYVSKTAASHMYQQQPNVGTGCTAILNVRVSRCQSRSLGTSGHQS